MTLSSIILKSFNNVAAVASGEEAVDYLKNDSVDILILDMRMTSGIDGLETYRRIQAFLPDQKAIITSGYSETSRVREAQRTGATRYLRKPYTPEEIGIAIKKNLKKKMGNLEITFF